MKLFRIALKSIHKWDTKIHNFYVIQDTKEKALEYVSTHKKDGYEVSKIWYLGYALGNCMFKGGEEIK